MKIITHLVTLFLATSLTQFAGSGAACAEPIKLTKGINIKFVFGGLAYMYARNTMRPDPCQGDVPGNPLIDYFKIPYDAVPATSQVPGGVRMKNVIGNYTYAGESRNDFADLDADGYDFARLMIEPISLGFTRDHPSIDTSSPGWEALLETIEEAKGHLNLVLALFPDAPSLNKYEKLFRDGLPLCVRNSTAITKRPWPGFYGWEYAWDDTDPALYISPPPNHPLGLFWSSLATHLDAALPGTGFNGIAFDINDEPLGAFMNEDASVGSNPNNLQWRSRWENATKNWRVTQLAGAYAILSVDNLATVIVSSYDAFGESYIPWSVYVANSPTRCRTYFQSYAEEYLEDANIVYHWHIFNPFGYTHFGESGYPYDDYEMKRDFGGLSNPGDPAPQWTSQWAPMTGYVQQAFNWILNWRLENYNVPVLITGFGVKEHWTTDLEHGTIIPGGTPPPPEPPSFTVTPMSHKAQYLYDVRTTAESYGLGWCTFEYLGTWRTYNGELSWPWANRYHLRTTFARPKVSSYHQGLFGSERPENIDP